MASEPHSIETEVALLRQRADSRDEEILSLLQSIKEHMEKEDERWAEITHRLGKLETVNLKQKTFVGALIIVISAIWGAAVVALRYFGGIHIG